MRILIADDSIVSRHLLDATLRKWGYEVVVANDGSEAWNVLQGEEAPRVAILDWVMPGLTGPEVCKRVREHAKDKDSDYTYILLLSSKSQREDLIEGMESGADDYLTVAVRSAGRAQGAPARWNAHYRSSTRAGRRARSSARTGHQRLPHAHLEPILGTRDLAEGALTWSARRPARGRAAG